MAFDIQVTAIVPKKKGRGAKDFNANLSKRIDLAYERFFGVLENDLKRVVKTWKKKPTFTYKRQRRGASETFSTQVNDPRWKWLNDGTPPRRIVPVRAKRLRFMSGYEPATAPNRIISKQARSFGDTVYSLGVDHPGIKARNFNQRLSKRNQPKFKQFMQDALKESIK